MQYLQLSCVVVDGDAAAGREMADFLAGRGLHVLSQLHAFEQLPPLLAGNESPQVVVITLDPAPRDTLRNIAPLIRQFPAVSFIVLSRVFDPDLLLDAMQAGVKHFVPLPINEERFLAGLERIARDCGVSGRGKIINVIPTIGGCGSTTIACNIATTLARSARTVLLDLDLIGGSVASCFDIQPRYTIADLMDPGGKLDRHLLENALALHAPSGLAILPRPERPEDCQRINQTAVNRLLGVLGRAFNYIVIDSPMSLDPLYATLLQTADANLLVAQLTVPSTRNAERLLGAYRRMGIDAQRTRLVVNRFIKRGGDVSPEQVENALGIKISWLIPNDFKNAMGALNYGEPVVLRTPKSELSTSLLGLAGSLNGKAAAKRTN